MVNRSIFKQPLNSMKVYSVLFLALLFTVSCEPGKREYKFESFKFDTPRVIDTMNDRHLKDYKWLEEDAWYAVYYAGPLTKNIQLQYPVKNIKYIDSNLIIPFPEINWAIKIIVDTSQLLSFESSLEGYAVFVINKGIDTMSLAFGLSHKGGEELNFAIPLRMEAKDTDSKWKPIQWPFSFLDNFGVNYINLPPDNIILTGMPMYKGAFRTKLRLEFSKEKIYSNEFVGYINRTQFIRRGDSAGENNSLKR